MKINNSKDTTLFSLPIRVYYEDTDAGGVVYHANYLNFFERARTEWLRSYGCEQDNLRTQQNVLFVIRNIDIAYLKPAVFNDKVSATIETIKTGRSSMEFLQHLQRDNEMGDVKILSKAKVLVVCVDAETFKPKRIPDDIHIALR